MRATIYSVIKGRVLITIHTKNPPTSEEWARNVRFVQELQQKDGFCTFVVTDGGAPNTEQRRLLIDAYAGREVPVAVISDAAIPKFVDASIAAQNKPTRSFSTEQFKEASEHLQLTSDEQREIIDFMLGVSAVTQDVPVKALELVLQNLSQR